jgi:hypothetical protein
MTLFRVDPLAAMFLFRSHGSSQPTRHFKPPWTLILENSDCYTVREANGVTVAWLFCRDDSRRYSFGASLASSHPTKRAGSERRSAAFRSSCRSVRVFTRVGEGHAGAQIVPIMLLDLDVQQD